MKLEGHLSGGLIISRIMIHWIRPENDMERRKLLALGTLGGFLPDLDYLYYAIKKRAIVYNTDFRHHTWVTHTFIFYWIPGLLLYWLAYIKKDHFLKKATAFLTAGCTTHLLQDMFGSGDGIKVFYPLSHKMYGYQLSGLHGKAWEKDYKTKPAYRFEQVLRTFGILILVLELFRWWKRRKK